MVAEYVLVRDINRVVGGESRVSFEGHSESSCARGAKTKELTRLLTPINGG